jgi:hypothetical protein
VKFFVFCLIPLFACCVLPHRPLRGPIDPFLSGDTFRAHSDYAYDEMSSFIPPNIPVGSLVFVSGEMIEEFFANIHPQILSKYILITHNSDHPFPGGYRLKTVTGSHTTKKH